MADYYHWVDGTGPCKSRPLRKHPTDGGRSRNSFGSPEFFELLRATGAEGLITVNAGTGTAAEAAAWVAYANRADGFVQPIGIKWWEVGNELYLPGNPNEPKITVTPEVYAQRFVEFSRAMRAVDPSIRAIAIGVAKSHRGPDTEYPDWTEKLLQRVAPDIDMIAVHNASFPMLSKVRQPPVDEVYPALWAAPEAVDRSLTRLERLIARYEGKRKIGIAVTEWGGTVLTAALRSLLVRPCEDSRLGRVYRPPAAGVHVPSPSGAGELFQVRGSGLHGLGRLCR
ncbi:MAG: hypothetical protein WCC36_16220 [Gammaproteobacteria bacterium]